MPPQKPVEILLRKALAQRSALSNEDLNQLTRLLSKWRHGLITNTLVAERGNVVQTGPFAGLRFVGEVTEGCSAPRLLGCYEHELHPYVERLLLERWDAVLNVGCADGYYAVGLATRLPAVPVFAHDLNPLAQAACRAVAELNGVGDRVTVGGLFTPADFAAFADKKTWLLMDIEGAERELLDPVASPGLRAMTVVVECHDCFIPGLTDTLARRFADSHRVTRVEHRLAAPPLPDWLQRLGHLDQLLATWEWREGPTPWLVMEPL
jgi:hypothetical protein